MTRGRFPERRRDRRHAFRATFRGRKLSPLGVELRGIVRGEIQDLGAGGFSMLTNQRIEEAQLLHGEILVPSAPAGIPTLVQVSWVSRGSKGTRYRVGLRFVL